MPRFSPATALYFENGLFRKNSEIVISNSILAMLNIALKICDQEETLELYVRNDKLLQALRIL